MIYSAGEDPGLISDVFVVREEFLNERPGAVAALLKAWDAALADYKADTDGGPGDHLRGGGRQARGARHRLRRRGLLFARREQDRALRPLHHQGHPGREAAAIKAGILTGEVDMSKAIDGRFVDAAAQ